MIPAPNIYMVALCSDFRGGFRDGFRDVAPLGGAPLIKIQQENDRLRAGRNLFPIARAAFQQSAGGGEPERT